MTEPMFYCATLPSTGGIARLHGDEARHAMAARRLQVGDTLWLFDGRGNVARARLQVRHERTQELELVVDQHQRLPPPRPIVHLACALPKGDRAAVMLDMATQLGIASFTPLLCERSVVKPGAGVLERLRRVCLEACKQSRRAWLPEIHPPATMAELDTRGGAVWIAHPDGAPVDQLMSQPQETLTILIGPEGGFTTEEVAQAIADGAIRVALGSAILRVETAAVAILGMAMLGVASPD